MNKAFFDSMCLHKVLLYYHTIRHMTPGLIINRIRVRAKRKLLSFTHLGSFLYNDRAPYAIISKNRNNIIFPGIKELFYSPISPKLLNSIEQAGEDLRRHRFSYLNETSIYTDKIDWDDKSRSRLWRLNLHYFDMAPLWILDVVLNGNKETFIEWKKLVDSWIAANPIGHFEAWNPYCVSRRIPNWILAYVLTAKTQYEDEHFNERIFNSLYRQASYLYGNVEWDLPMNHLISNGRALFYAGVFFQGKKGRKWRDLGLRILWDRLEHDVCNDGGHAERSPMYHLLVLQDNLECFAISRELGIAWPSQAVSTLYKMVEFSRKIEHPDGDIPLFNDSALKVATKSSEVVEVAGGILGNKYGKKIKKEFGHESIFSLVYSECNSNQSEISACQRKRILDIKEFPETGYYVISGPEVGRKIIFDCGEIGIREVAGHGHSDLLSFEMSINGQRIIVDSGTSTYSSGKCRQYEKSILAHNTLIVDGKDTCEPWASFRMARRGHPDQVRTVQKNDFAIIDAGHSSFLGLPGIVHRRALLSLGDTLVILDRVIGNGQHSVKGRLHFHPNVELKLNTSDKNLFSITSRFCQLNLKLFSCTSELLLPTEDYFGNCYAPEFGKRQQKYTLNIERAGELPILLGLVLIKREVKSIIRQKGDVWTLVLKGQLSYWEADFSYEGFSINSPFLFKYNWL